MGRSSLGLGLTLLGFAALGATALAGQPTKRPTDEERGRELYARHCVSCHGPKNHGDGPATAALVVPVPDLAGRVVADKATAKLVLDGKGPMPAFAASFDNEDARRVVAHMAKVHELDDAKPAPAEPKPEPEEGTEAGPG